MPLFHIDGAIPYLCISEAAGHAFPPFTDTVPETRAFDEQQTVARTAEMRPGSRPNVKPRCSPPGRRSAAAADNANIKRAVVGSAEKMPPEHFVSKPTPEVRSFAQLVGHIVEVNYQFCSAVKGVPNPNAGRKLEALTDKAALVQAARDGFAFCDDAFAKTADQNVVELITVGQAPNTRQIARGNQLVFAVTHSNEHYGNLVTYMRLKGVVPPTSEQ